MLTFVIRENTSEIFEKIILKVLVLTKRFKFPFDDRIDTNFIAPLRMHF